LPVYKQRTENVIQTILLNHYSDFESAYDEKYSKDYGGEYRIVRIHEAVEKFKECGDYSKGIARIKCTNQECKHEYFRPFSCKQWYLCSSCHQKRVLLLSEHLCKEVLLKLPHRQFVFTIPKFLRIYFKYDRSLFADISKLIYSILNDYYSELKNKQLKSGAVISFQTAGDILRWNAHWHCIFLEGGIDENNDFYYCPIKNLSSLTEVFRRKVIAYFVKKELVNQSFANKTLNWKHSGFSVDNSVWLLKYDDKARMNLCQYIARHPVSLKKVTYVKDKGKVFYKTKYNEYFKENVKLFNVLDFIADLTIHIPPKGKHLIRYYGLYSSRSKGKNKENGINDKFGVKAHEVDDNQSSDEMTNVESVSSKKSKQTWAKLIQRVYEIDPLVCPKCQSEMKVIAVITEYDDIQKILACLKKNKSPPFDKQDNTREIAA
jgi:hypothetical protein